MFPAPAVIMFCIIFLYPIFRTVAMSFFKIEGVTDAVSKWQFSGFANYIKLFNTELFRISMWLQYVFSPKFGLFKSIGELLHWKWLAKFQWLDPSHLFIALLIAYCFGLVARLEYSECNRWPIVRLLIFLYVGINVNGMILHVPDLCKLRQG